MNRITKLLLALLVATVGFTTQAQAQIGPYSGSGTSAVGLFLPVYNVQDSTLFDGELVMADTATTALGGLKRIGVKRFDGTALGRARIVGIVAQPNIARSSQRGTGRVLCWGYHPAAYVGLSDLAGMRPIKLGLVNAMFQGADTLEAACGVAISRTSAATSVVNTGPRYRYKVYFWGTRLAGATL